jgi:hypothetical protein
LIIIDHKWNPVNFYNKKDQQCLGIID